MSEHVVNVSEIFRPLSRTLHESLDLVTPLIPTQGPIKEFIHHNTLHSFQHLPFGTAIAQNHWLQGAQVNYMLTQVEEKKWLESLDAACGSSGVLRRGLRYHRAESSGYNVDNDLLPILIKLTSSYYDQGLAVWSHPSDEVEELSFWEVTRRLATSSVIPLVPFNRNHATKLLELDAERAVEGALKFLCSDDLRTRYLAEFLTVLPGWAGFVHEVEVNPSQLLEGRKSRLLDWLAVGLVAELGFLEKHAAKWINLSGKGSVDLARHLTIPASEVFEMAGSRLEKALLTNEWQVYNQILEQTARASQRSLSGTKSHSLATDESWQVITCIDDRNFSLRAFLEDEWPEVETFGAAGFFGVDTLIQEGATAKPVKHCPAPVTPGHLLRVDRKSAKKARLGVWEHESANVLRSWLAPQLLGPLSAFKLLLGAVAPEWIERTRLHKDDVNVRIDPFFSGQVDDGLRHGYTVEEAVVRIYSLLRTMGITKKFADFIAIVGHGSSSANNPYFAAYDCGACSGRPGSLNALAFCVMANDSRVRDALRKKGLVIPEKTTFVPFLYDTSTDTIILVGDPEMHQSHKSSIDRFTERFARALARNAQFRCRQFKLASTNFSQVNALRHVARRAVAWFEPRPEYNHATNIACIVGRRALTKGLRTEQAIFLQSYDPEVDQEGSLLTGVLGAVIPVCGGINLEYLFSRIDPEIYGAGSKLPHNVSGLNGVMTGFEGDLRTGLPRQMTEIHNPMRLLIVVEQDPTVILNCLERLPHLRSWVDQRWVWLVSQDPDSGVQLVYKSGVFVAKEYADVI